jgi:uncharacterized protein
MPCVEMESIRRTLESLGDFELAIVFGSVATGEAGSDSDVDLAVLGDHPFTAEERLRLLDAIALATGRAVDLVDLRTVGEPLLGEILKHGTKLLGTDEQYARLVTQHLFDAADFLPYRDRILEERRMAWIGK